MGHRESLEVKTNLKTQEEYETRRDTSQQRDIFNPED